MIELSVVIPCLNEEETIGICLKKVCTTLNNNQVNYEVIVADNNSTDRSIEICSEFHKVKVINVKTKGYGATLQAGIAEASGRYILMADADDSYDFNDVMKFLQKLRDGFELVQGCRFPSGGGTIMPGAMPLSHRIFGNPFLSKLARLLYNIPFKDIYCGMRAFKKSIYLKSTYFSNGMVFAVENLIKLTIVGAKVCEVPITLYKDKRVKSKSHLNTINDGLKTLKLLLICNAKWLYFYPAALIVPFLFTKIYTSHNITIHKDLLYDDILINFFSIFAMSTTILQLITLGIFSTLMSNQLGLIKKNFIIKLLVIFNLKKVLTILFVFIALFAYLVFKISKEQISNINYIFYTFLFGSFTIQSIFNCLFISLLELNDANKKVSRDKSI
jgi:glycosyltransferase involved in cell wall biosynthesis